MQSAAAACICNLAANLNSKEIIATSGALQVGCGPRIRRRHASFWAPFFCAHGCLRFFFYGGGSQVLVEVLQSENQAAAAQAAGALWSLCVDNDANKQVTRPPTDCVSVSG